MTATDATDPAVHWRPLAFRVAAQLETWPGLDPLIGPVRSAVLRAPAVIRDALHGKQAGHPLHPVAVLVPAGAWLSAFVLDATGGSRTAARTLVGVGVLTAAPAAVSGLADWAVLNREQERVGAVHAVANVAGTAAYGISWLARRRGAHGLGVVLGVAGLGLIGVAGFLGGHLTYRQGANVTRPEPFE